MRTLFLNGLMPERQGTFIRLLLERYHLAGTRLPRLAGMNGGRILNFHQSATRPALAASLEDRVVEETLLLAESLANDIVHSPVGPETGWKLDDQYLTQTLKPRVAEMLLQEAQFRKFLEQHPVDMVISGSDFSSHSKPIARTARSLGIPTLDLEHGYFFNHVVPEYGRPYGKMPLIFSSEFVNLDNAMEKELLETDARNFPDQGNRFLDLGTPIDDMMTTDLHRPAALAALERDPAKKQVLMLGTWCEARNVSKLLTAQVDLMETYQDLFASLAQSPLLDNIQLTFKLHPAEAHPQIFEKTRGGLLDLARSCGIDDLLILGDRLPEALLCADTVVSLGFSSVLYDAFQQHKPTIVVFPPYARYEDKAGWLTKSTMPFHAGISRGVTEGKEAWAAVQETLNPDWLEEFEGKWTAFADRYGLHHRTVEEKAARIMAWIDEYLEERDR